MVATCYFHLIVISEILHIGADGQWEGEGGRREGGQGEEMGTSAIVSTLKRKKK